MLLSFLPMRQLKLEESGLFVHGRVSAKDRGKANWPLRFSFTSLYICTMVKELSVEGCINLFYFLNEESWNPVKF